MSRDIPLTFRVSKNELDDIKDAASHLGVSVSRYLRILSVAPVDELTQNKFNTINSTIVKLAKDWFATLNDLQTYIKEESVK